MSKLDMLVSGIIVASDKYGRNKVRFCVDVGRRLELLTQQQFTIHDVIISENKLSRIDMLKFAMNQKLNDTDSYNLIIKVLHRYDNNALREMRKQNLLQEIASRPKRNTDLSAEQMDNLLGSI